MPTHDSTTSRVRFRPIQPGYFVSDDGSVWSAFRGRWRRLKPHPQSRGHCTVDLGKRNTRFVHRLVLEAFVGPCPDGMECRHLDGNPGNNRLENLAWGTPKENAADSIRHGTSFFLTERGRTVGRKGRPVGSGCKITRDQVAIIRAIVDPEKRDGTAGRLAREWDISPSMIRMIARGLRRCTL